MSKVFVKKTEIPKRVKDEWQDAHDFDPRDPLFGLSKEALSGPGMSRRSALRLMAAAGTLSLWHLLPGAGARRAHAASGGTLRCGWSGVPEIQTIDPAKINQALQFQISSNVISGLMHIDNQLVPQGDLAESWTVSDDGTQWTFKLREGVTFHNGDRFTAEDVVFTYQRSRNPENSLHSRVVANVKDVIAVDDHTVKFMLGEPQASFLGKTLERSAGRAMAIVSRGALAAMGEAEYGLKAVGTGPFRVTAHTLGQDMVLERFDDYYDPERPKLDKVIITPVNEAEPLAAAMEAGDIQFIGGNEVPPELIDRFNDNPDIVVEGVPAPGFEAVWINPWREPFVVPDFDKPLSELMQEKGFMVRLALAKALDRDWFIERAQFGRAYPAYGTINPAMGYFFDENLGESSNQRYDVEEAKRLLAEAGYPNGEGVRTLKGLVRTDRKREMEVIRHIYKRNLNIEIEVDPKDFPVLIDEFWAMDWDLLRIGSAADFDPDDGLVDWMQTASKFNGPKRDREKMPFGFFSEKRADELIDRQNKQTDPAVRKQMVQEANKITSDKVAAAFLYHPTWFFIFHKSVNFPEESRITGLSDLDRASIST